MTNLPIGTGQPHRDYDGQFERALLAMLRDAGVDLDLVLPDSVQFRIQIQDDESGGRERGATVTWKSVLHMSSDRATEYIQQAEDVPPSNS